MKKIQFVFVFSLSFLIFSCGDERPRPDVSSVDIEYRSFRFDKDFFRCNFSDSSAVQALYRKYGVILVEYAEGMMRLGPVDSAMTFAIEADEMTSVPQIRELQEEVERIFTDPVIRDIDNQLSEAFKFFHHYFPDTALRPVVYLNTVFNYGIYPTPEFLGIGLDFFIGTENDFIKGLPPEIFPQYQRNKMRPDYIVPNAMFGMMAVMHQDLYDESNLLETMSFYGKMMYLLDIVLPDIPDSTKMNYSGPEMAWANAYEYNTWKEMANQDVLYNTKAFEIRKWINDGPFTKAGNIPTDSPSRLGIFIGWRMVRNYMNKHPEVTVSQLLYETKASEILRFYKPKKP
jgi:hypothetical protein